MTVIHIDWSYSAYILLALAGLFIGILCVVLEAIEANGLETDAGKRTHLRGAVIISCVFVIAASGVYLWGFRSGQIYHPCVVKNWETMEKVCK